eukprot:1144614-Pelagomonas_calceolata.AAC.9
MADTEAPFAIGEKVFVPHTDKYYEAKVLKSEYRGQGGWYYFLHYNGWNKKYDEWVEAVGLVKADQAAAVGALVGVGASVGRMLSRASCPMYSYRSTQ